MLQQLPVERNASVSYGYVVHEVRDAESAAHQRVCFSERVVGKALLSISNEPLDGLHSMFLAYEIYARQQCKEQTPQVESAGFSGLIMPDRETHKQNWLLGRCAELPLLCPPSPKVFDPQGLEC